MKLKLSFKKDQERVTNSVDVGSSRKPMTKAHAKNWKAGIISKVNQIKSKILCERKTRSNLPKDCAETTKFSSDLLRQLLKQHISTIKIVTESKARNKKNNFNCSNYHEIFATQSSKKIVKIFEKAQDLNNSIENMKKSTEYSLNNTNISINLGEKIAQLNEKLWEASERGNTLKVLQLLKP